MEEKKSFVYWIVFFFSFNLFVGFLFLSTEKNKKRDIRNWYQSANDRYNDAIEEKPRDNSLRRGDIPILHGDCDGKRYTNLLTAFRS